jgi:acyl-CoA reductase-like NAD-dependent aldehyde dehydrogenase
MAEPANLSSYLPGDTLRGVVFQIGAQGFITDSMAVVAGARQDDEIVRKEVFGPVVSVTRFDDVDQAVA